MTGVCLQTLHWGSWSGKTSKRINHSSASSHYVQPSCQNSPWAPEHWWAARTCRTGHHELPGSCSGDRCLLQNGQPGNADSSHNVAAPRCLPAGNHACGVSRKCPGLSCMDNSRNRLVNDSNNVLMDRTDIYPWQTFSFSLGSRCLLSLLNTRKRRWRRFVLLIHKMLWFWLVGWSISNVRPSSKALFIHFFVSKVLNLPAVSMFSNNTVLVLGVWCLLCCAVTQPKLQNKSFYLSDPFNIQAQGFRSNLYYRKVPPFCFLFPVGRTGDRSVVVVDTACCTDFSTKPFQRVIVTFW